MTGIRAFYGRWAALYDRIATFPGVGRWRARAADALNLSPGDTVVEMGCGSGANLPHLRERVAPGGMVVGIDLTRPLIKHARGRAAGNAHLVCGDATRPPVCEADAVLGTFVTGMFADPATVVDRWCDLVGQGGRIALLDMTGSDWAAGRPLNPAFRAFTVLSAPSGTAREAMAALTASEAGTRLDERVGAARGVLAERTVERRYEEFGLGFVGLMRGRVA